MSEEIFEITKQFHNTYERLSSEYGYETRKETRVFDENSSNGKLMFATVNEVVRPILEENQELKRQLNEKIISEMKLRDKIEEQRKEYQETYKDVREEIKEYKRQLENCYCNRTDCSSRIKDSKKYDSLVQKAEKQQKEFMEWLESKITEHKILIYGEDELNECLSITKEAFELALLKYKEIIGDK